MQLLVDIIREFQIDLATMPICCGVIFFFIGVICVLFVVGGIQTKSRIVAVIAGLLVGICIAIGILFFTVAKWESDRQSSDITGYIHQMMQKQFPENP